MDPSAGIHPKTGCRRKIIVSKQFLKYDLRNHYKLLFSTNKWIVPNIGKQQFVAFLKGTHIRDDTLLCFFLQISPCAQINQKTENNVFISFLNFVTVLTS